MKLNNSQLTSFVNRIKLKQENMPAYREQLKRLQHDLDDYISKDVKTGVRVTRIIVAGSWKKGTILRPTGDWPIDIDLVLYIEGDESLRDDLGRLHDLMVGYLGDIYPTKDIRRDVDAEGKTRSVKIKFTGSGLEVDIVPAVPLKTPAEYVWLPQRGGGGKYITSVTKQLDFAKSFRDGNPYYTAMVRCLKWWRNYKELEELSSYTIELIVSHLETTKGKTLNIEDGLIRFFEFLSASPFPTINFKNAINAVPQPMPKPFIADSTNNENNAARKIDNDALWQEIRKAANDAFETLTLAQSRNSEGDTITEWKSIFGPSFNINPEN